MTRLGAKLAHFTELVHYALAVLPGSARTQWFNDAGSYTNTLVWNIQSLIFSRCQNNGAPQAALLLDPRHDRARFISATIAKSAKGLQPKSQLMHQSEPMACLLLLHFMACINKNAGINGLQHKPAK